MATKKADKVNDLDQYLFSDGKFDFKAGLRRSIESVIIVETLKTLVREDKEIKGTSTLEDLQDICRKFHIDGALWRGKELETVKNVVEQYFHSQITSGEKMSDLYKEYFTTNEMTYNFQDYLLGDDAIPKKGQPMPPDMKYEVETLGTGEYPVDDKGKEMPHPEEFIDECIMEISHFKSHMAGGTDAIMFLSNKEPDFQIGSLEDEKIYLMVKFQNPFDLLN